MLNRKDFLRFVTMAGASQVVGLGQQAQATPKLQPGKSEKISLSNDHFRLSLTAGDGLKCQLLHIPSGTTLADEMYSYSFGLPSFSAIPTPNRKQTSVG